MLHSPKPKTQVCISQDTHCVVNLRHKQGRDPTSAAFPQSFQQKPPVEPRVRGKGNWPGFLETLACVNKTMREEDRWERAKSLGNPSFANSAWGFQKHGGFQGWRQRKLDREHSECCLCNFSCKSKHFPLETLYHILALWASPTHRLRGEASSLETRMCRTGDRLVSLESAHTQAVPHCLFLSRHERPWKFFIWLSIADALLEPFCCKPTFEECSLVSDGVHSYGCKPPRLSLLFLSCPDAIFGLFLIYSRSNFWW